MSRDLLAILWGFGSALFAALSVCVPVGPGMKAWYVGMAVMDGFWAMYNLAFLVVERLVQRVKP